MMTDAKIENRSPVLYALEALRDAVECRSPAVLGSDTDRKWKLIFMCEDALKSADPKNDQRLSEVLSTFMDAALGQWPGHSVDIYANPALLALHQSRVAAAIAGEPVPDLEDAIHKRGMKDPDSAYSSIMKRIEDSDLHILIKFEAADDQFSLTISDLASRAPVDDELRQDIEALVPYLMFTEVSDWKQGQGTVGNIGMSPFHAPRLHMIDRETGNQHAAWIEPSRLQQLRFTSSEIDYVDYDDEPFF